MPDKSEKNPYSFAGLTDVEAADSQRSNGLNEIAESGDNGWWPAVKAAATEPMFLLLLACTIIYFSLGQWAEGWFMLGAIIVVSAISLYQDNKSRKALEALKEYTRPHATVIRNNELLQIATSQIVLNDVVVVSEGELIPADGTVLQANDLTVNESVMTGEPYGVTKQAEGSNNEVYSGTLVASGQCVYKVTAIGAGTRLGKLGLSIDNISRRPTQLQQQISSFVKKMAITGAVIFVAIWGINFIRYGDITGSLLKGLTIAMSVLPEEIPVAFATFMALGAWRLMKMGVIVKQTGTVEALGAASVLCTDKTGTITENRMELHSVYNIATGTTSNKETWKDEKAAEVIAAAMWASEKAPFDPMEQALHSIYAQTAYKDERPDYEMVHEYPLSGKPPMMTHIFRNSAGTTIIASKGAPEAIMACASLSEANKAGLLKAIEAYAKDGLRVLGVGITENTTQPYPAQQQDYKLNMLGLVAFYDPPKKDIDKVFEALYGAGIQVKIITGDNQATAQAIARQAGFKGYEQAITGDKLPTDEAGFDKAVADNNIFSRIFPELKLSIIESLKRQGHIVGMTGDGVNDGPALKAADIGIAMGKRGSEIARQASALILTDDDFGKMTVAVAMGRSIYANLKKAIQYIISIHIPIILVVAIPSVLGWIYPSIFTPVHVIFLELIMGPTCSVIYENEPAEPDIMLQPPRHTSASLFSGKELLISILQGAGITAGLLVLYQYCAGSGMNESTTRSMIFTALIMSNILLTLVNRSFFYSVLQTISYRNNLMVYMILLTLALLAALLYVPLFSSFFSLQALLPLHLAICAGTAVVSVSGIEVYKLIVRHKAGR